ncbi:MAG: hypothetical protein GY696_30720, partial [Gammaproteobacteria bacterium]|nr:hypothetical protein [Gammaproteobacteria bacterium]
MSSKGIRKIIADWENIFDQMAEGGAPVEALQGARRGEREEATPPQDEDPFRPSTTMRRSPSVAVRLEQSAGRQPMPVVHELGQNRIDGVTPEPILEGQRTGSNDLITPAPPSRPVPLSRGGPSLNAEKQPAFSVRENQFLGNPLGGDRDQFTEESRPGFDFRSGGLGARPKTTAPFGARFGQQKQ